MRTACWRLTAALIASSLFAGCGGLKQVAGNAPAASPTSNGAGSSGAAAAPGSSSSSGAGSGSGSSSGSSSGGSSSGAAGSPSPAPPPVPSPSPTPSVQQPPSKFVYCIDTSASYVFGAVLNSDGTVSKIPYNDADATGAFVQQIVSDAQGKFLFASAAGPSARDQTNPSGITSFIINQADGTFSRKAPEFAKFGTMAVRPDARFLYLGTNSTLDTYAVDDQTGAISASTAASVTAKIAELLVNPAGTFLFSVASSGDGVSVWRLDKQTGVPVAISGSPFLTGSSSPELEAISPDGQFLFINGGNTIITMRINADGSLTHAASTQTTGTTNYIVVHPNGRFVYGVMAAPNNHVQLVGFRLDASGSLQLLPGSPFDDQQEFLTLTLGPPGDYMYGLGGNFTYSIDQQTGAVTKIHTTEGVGCTLQSIVVP